MRRLRSILLCGLLACLLLPAGCVQPQGHAEGVWAGHARYTRHVHRHGCGHRYENGRWVLDLPGTPLRPR